MENGKQYYVKQKVAEGQYELYGNIKQSDKGYWGLGMKVTPELKKLINGTEEGKWINFSIYEKKDATR